MNYIQQLVKQAKSWVRSTTGVFSEEQFAKACNLTFDPESCRNLIGDLIIDGTIQPHGTRHGQYTKADEPPSALNWQGATLDEYPIWMPLWLSKRVVISPGNIIVVAGEKNSGKTSLGRRITYENLKCNGGDHDTIHVWDYESHESEVCRMNNAINPDQRSWQGFDIQRVTKNFHQWIDPNGFNVIDYLKINEDFALIGRMIGAIHEKLQDGIAIVFLQKKRGEVFGRGGEFSLEEPRLGLSLFASGPSKWCRATKVKVPREGCYNLEDMEIDYRLERGAHFVEKTDWRYVNKKSREKILEDDMFDATKEMAEGGF